MQEVPEVSLSLLSIKNYFLAPFFEEFIYRACILNVFIEANVLSINKTILILPAFFAVCKINDWELVYIWI